MTVLAKQGTNNDRIIRVTVSCPCEKQLVLMIDKKLAAPKSRFKRLRTKIFAASLGSFKKPSVKGAAITQSFSKKPSHERIDIAILPTAKGTKDSFTKPRPFLTAVFNISTKIPIFNDV